MESAHTSQESRIRKNYRIPFLLKTMGTQSRANESFLIIVCYNVIACRALSGG